MNSYFYLFLDLELEVSVILYIIITKFSHDMILVLYICHMSHVMVTQSHITRNVIKSLRTIILYSILYILTLRQTYTL